MAPSQFLTTKQAARRVSEVTGIPIEEWRIRRLYESEDLPEPARFGGKRLLAESDLPAIVDAMRARGWLPQPEAAHA